MGPARGRRVDAPATTGTDGTEGSRSLRSATKARPAGDARGIAPALTEATRVPYFIRSQRHKIDQPSRPAVPGGSRRERQSRAGERGASPAPGRRGRRPDRREDAQGGPSICTEPQPGGKDQRSAPSSMAASSRATRRTRTRREAGQTWRWPRMVRPTCKADAGRSRERTTAQAGPGTLSNADARLRAGSASPATLDYGQRSGRGAMALTGRRSRRRSEATSPRRETNSEPVREQYRSARAAGPAMVPERNDEGE